YREDWKFVNGSGTAISIGGATIWAQIVVNAVQTDGATFVTETFPDNTVVGAGQSFFKTWTIHNSGTTTWNSNYTLQWVSGNLSSHATVAVSGTVTPGSNYTFSVPMTAPNNAGTYRE